MSSVFTRNVLRAVGLALLAALPIVVQHLFVRTMIRRDRADRAETDSQARADLLQAKLTAQLDKLARQAGSLAEQDSIREAAGPARGRPEEEIAKRLRDAKGALSAACFQLDAGTVAWLVSAEGKILAASRGDADVGKKLDGLDPGVDLRGKDRTVVAMKDGPDRSYFFQALSPVRTTGLRLEVPAVVIRTPAIEAERMLHSAAEGMRANARVLALDASGRCVIDTDQDLRGESFAAPTPEDSARWESESRFGDRTASMLRELAPAPRLLSVIGRLSASDGDLRYRSIGLANLELLSLGPREDGLPEIRFFDGVAALLLVIVAGSVLLLTYLRRRAEASSWEVPFWGPFLAGVLVLGVAAGGVLYASRAIRDRGRELLRAFALRVERSLQSDVEDFVEMRRAFFSQAAERVRQAPDTRAEFFTQGELAKSTFPDGKFALYGLDDRSPLVLFGEEAPEVTAMAELPRGQLNLLAPAVYLNRLDSEDARRLLFDAPFATPGGTAHLIWAFDLLRSFDRLFAEARTSGFNVRLVRDSKPAVSIYPRGTPPEGFGFGRTLFHFPREGKTFYLILDPQVDLFGTEASRATVLTIGMLLAVVSAVGTTLVLGSLVGYRRASRVDALTGLRNRLEFGELAERERLRALRYGRPLSIALIDLDHFKRVNDTLGHAAGDETLRTVGRELREAVRSTDLVFRHGGEEFAVLLPEADAESARLVLERIRERFAAMKLAAGAPELSITLSCGVATAEGSESIDSVLARADAALYRAKRAGRNRVVSAGTQRESESGLILLEAAARVRRGDLS